MQVPMQQVSRLNKQCAGQVFRECTLVAQREIIYMSFISMTQFMQIQILTVWVSLPTYGTKQTVPITLVLWIKPVVLESPSITARVVEIGWSNKSEGC